MPIKAHEFDGKAPRVYPGNHDFKSIEKVLLPDGREVTQIYAKYGSEYRPVIPTSTSYTLGVHVDLVTKEVTRTGDAVGLTAGADFDQFSMYQRKRCVMNMDGSVRYYIERETIVSNPATQAGYYPGWLTSSNVSSYNPQKVSALVPVTPGEHILCVYSATSSYEINTQLSWYNSGGTYLNSYSWDQNGGIHPTCQHPVPVPASAAYVGITFMCDGTENYQRLTYPNCTNIAVYRITAPPMPDLGGTTETAEYSIMVEQPAFYYKVTPTYKNGRLVALDYAISDVQQRDFKLHPAFRDRVISNHKLDNIYIGAFKACYYDASLSDGYVNCTRYIRDVGAYTDTTTDIDYTNDRLYSKTDTTGYSSSYPNLVKEGRSYGTLPVNNKYKNLLMSNAERLANTSGSGWHLYDVDAYSAQLLLMLIEYASFDMQTSIGRGVVDLNSSSEKQRIAYTGSTYSLVNESGQTRTTSFNDTSSSKQYRTNGRLSVSYRGAEDLWGDEGEIIAGIMVAQDENKQLTYQLYSGYDYTSTDLIDTEFAAPIGDSTIVSFHYTPTYDYLFLPQQVTSDSTPLAPDRYFIETGSGATTLFFTAGGRGYDGNNAGAFCVYLWSSASISGNNTGHSSYRLIYRPDGITA